MLIIGKANTNYGILEPHYWNNPSAVREAYGEKSNLTYAFNEAYSIGVKDIFLLNIQKQRDYLEVIDTIKQTMTANGALGALMSGSGPTVFGLYDDEKKAKDAYCVLKQGNLAKQVFLTRPVN